MSGVMYLHAACWMCVVHLDATCPQLAYIYCSLRMFCMLCACWYVVPCVFRFSRHAYISKPGVLFHSRNRVTHMYWLQIGWSPYFFLGVVCLLGIKIVTLPKHLLMKEWQKFKIELDESTEMSNASRKETEAWHFQWLVQPMTSPSLKDQVSSTLKPRAVASHSVQNESTSAQASKCSLQQYPIHHLSVSSS